MKKILVVLTITSIVLTGCQSQLSLNQLQLNQLPFIPISVEDFWTNFLADLAASAIIGVLLYFIIDHRIQKSQEKRAYQVLNIVLRRTVAKLDYFESWLGSQKQQPDESFQGRIEIPSRLRSSVYLMWKESRDTETLQQLDPEFLAKFEMVLEGADSIFQVLNMLNGRYSISEEVLDALDFTRAESLKSLLPIVRTVRRKIGDRWVSEKKWRQRLQKELIEIDREVALYHEKFENLQQLL